MEVSIDETKVKEWMNEFCSTYDSIGKIRSITTPTGKTASVSGGTYGWSVDEPEEIRKLIENIKSGERVEREPVYEKTVASHSQYTTYAALKDLPQHMYLPNPAANEMLPFFHTPVLFLLFHHF